MNAKQEEEFDELFHNEEQSSTYSIKAFISKLLEEERERVLGEIEELKNLRPDGITIETTAGSWNFRYIASEDDYYTSSTSFNGGLTEFKRKLAGKEKNDQTD